MAPEAETDTGLHRPGARGARLWLARGARAAEAVVLEAALALADQSRREPGLLARPVRVVVPSRSLREHVAARLVERAGRALAGIRVQSLHGLAMEVIDAAGEGAPVGDPVFPVLVRRAARETPALGRLIEELEDGDTAVAAEVADLLDAGWDPAVPVHAEALEEVLEAERPAVAERARAVAEVARRVARDLERLGCGRRGDRMRRAAALLAEAPERHLPCRAVLVHGFADATAVASDLIDALVGVCAAQVVLDEPPDPADPERPTPGLRYTHRLRERLGRLPPEAAAAAPASPRIALLRAPGAHAEVRAVAERIRRLLDAGTRPESVGVVARSLEPYRLPLRLHFRRLGIPFSGLGATAPPAAAGRRLGALLDLLGQGPRLSAERWLELAESSGPAAAGRRADLRLALHGLGVARLEGLAGLDVAGVLEGRDFVPLAARWGLAGADDDFGGEAGSRRGRAHRRRLGRRSLEDAVARASSAGQALRAWPDPAPFPRHRAELEALADVHLGWAGLSPERRALASALAALEDELPGHEPFSRDELRILLGRGLGDVGCEPLGGAGAGVQVLGVVEARARTFGHLFLLGMNRDVFPRPLVEAPLLPDDLRRRLEGRLLPEIPVKRRGADEEHYLFAQLLAASPEVVVSWQEVDDDGRRRSPSPLLERLRIARADLEEEAVPATHARPAATAWFTAAEAATLEGLHGRREGLSALLTEALRERREDAGSPPPGAAPAPVLARVRLAVLAEQDAGPAPAPRLGPYFGFVGPVALAADPRHRDLYVTHLEGLARCPWKTFVTRLLGVEPPPDALAGLPSLGSLRGAIVHRALEELVRESWPQGEPPERLEACAGGRAVVVLWPGRERLEALVLESAEEMLRQEGLGPPALARLLAVDALPFVEAAQGLAWSLPDAGGGIVGVEVRGRAEVSDASGCPRTLHFRADRVDRAAGGALRLLDYKTGKPLSAGAKEETRAKALRAAIAAGTHLQASAYAAAGGGEGVYVFLAAGEGPGGRVAVAAGDDELHRLFRGAVATGLAALDAGGLFPRLTDPDGASVPSACGWCEVRDACLQGDSGARLRLAGWMHDPASGAASPAEAAARSLWWIGGEESGEPGEAGPGAEGADPMPQKGPEGKVAAARAPKRRRESR